VQATPRVAPLWATVFVAFACLYLFTAQRGVSWQDSGMFQWRILAGDYKGELGLALSHPLYIGMGRAAGALNIGDFAWRLNALSGIGMALAIANLAGAVCALTNRRWVAAVVAVTVGLAHTAWWLGTIAEVYTWTAAGLAAEMWLMISLIRRPARGKLAALALISGLGWSIHNFALLPLPVYIVLAVWMIWGRRQLRPSALALAAGAYIIGASPYLVMIAQEAAELGFIAAVKSALFGRYAQQVLAVAPTGGMLKVNMALSAMNFVNMLIPLAVFGWWRLRRQGKAMAAAIAAVTAIELVFFVRYPVPDQFTFILPSLMMIGLGAGLGLSELANRVPARVLAPLCLLLALLQPGVYAMAPGLVHRLGLTPSREVERPFRDETSYWLVPWKHHETSAQRFAEAALTQAKPGDVIVADSTSLHPLLLVQRLHSLGEDVIISDTRSAAE